MRFFVIILMLALANAFPVFAEENLVEYSADLIEKMAGGEERKGRIFVGNNRMRMEMVVDGRTMIQVVNAASQTMMLINPQEKTYMSRTSGVARPGIAADASGNPCDSMQNLDCKRVGKESVNGIDAEKWEVRSRAAGNGGTMQFWIDEKRKFPLRQIMPDGSRMELGLAGNEKIQGRDTEKWVRVLTGTDGKSLESHQWYDPVIKANIREEQPGGYSRTMSNIKVGSQPDALFTAPEGYRRLGSGQ